MVKTHNEPAKSSEDTISIDMQQLLTPIAILVAALMISLTIFTSLNKLTDQMNGKTPSNTGTQAAGDTAAPTQAGQAENQKASTKIDDDAVKGNKSKAKVGIVEFSDYECPFCRRFYSQTLSQIVSNYVDNNKAIFVYRDLPLDALHPNARNSALAAECAGEQGNDKYLAYHNAIFETEDVLSKDKLKALASDIKLDTGKFNDCFDNNKMADEIKKDEQDATAIGINGTPGFVVGTLKSDGTVEGEVISGAVPYAEFEKTIEKYL